jgi:hypothetical protein
MKAEQDSSLTVAFAAEDLRKQVGLARTGSDNSNLHHT